MNPVLDFKAVERFLQTSHKVEGFMKHNSTCYILEVKESDPFTINDFLIPEKTNCGSWQYMWVATEGTIAKGKLMVIPLHKKAKQFLQERQVERYVKLGVSEAEALILSKIIKHKPFEKDKFEITKGLLDNPKAFKELEISFKNKLPNQERYRVFKKNNIPVPVDYKTLEKLYHELSRFYNWKGNYNEKSHSLS